LDLSGVRRISTSIVTSLRLLSGASFLGQPVRHVWELCNLVGEGKGRVTVGDRTLQYGLWRGKCFKQEDLDDYLSEESALYSAVWAGYQFLDLCHKFKSCQIIERKCLMDLESSWEVFHKTFRELHEI
jgi:hypothetical protein